MRLEELQNQMINAMKNGHKLRKEVISNLIASVKKEAIDKGMRDNITEELVDEVILKEKKILEEMIAGCPESRKDLKISYKTKLIIIEEFAPKLMETEEEISEYVRGLGLEITKANRGVIMKQLKGKANLQTANKVIEKLLN